MQYNHVFRYLGRNSRRSGYYDEQKCPSSHTPHYHTKIPIKNTFCRILHIEIIMFGVFFVLLLCFAKELFFIHLNNNTKITVVTSRAKRKKNIINRACTLQVSSQWVCDTKQKAVFRLFCKKKEEKNWKK